MPAFYKDWAEDILKIPDAEIYPFGFLCPCRKREDNINCEAQSSIQLHYMKT